MKKLQELSTKYIDASLFFDEKNALMILSIDGVKTSGDDVETLIKKQREEWKKRAYDFKTIEKELELIYRKIRPEYKELGVKIKQARMGRCDYIVIADSRWLSIALCPYTSRFFVIYNEDKIPMKINITSKDPRSLLEELRRVGAVNVKEFEELREQVERIRIIEYPESSRAWEELRKLAGKRGITNVRGTLRLVKKVGVGNYEEVRIEDNKAIYRSYFITFDENVNPRIVAIDFDLSQYKNYPMLATPRTL